MAPKNGRHRGGQRPTIRAACSAVIAAFTIALGGCVTAGSPHLPRGATAVDGGGVNTCALLDGGTVTCWGERYGDPLNQEVFFEIASNTNTAEPIVGITNATVVSGECALLEGGTVTCWAGNDSSEHRSPQPVVGVMNATAISGNVNHMCAVLDGGTVSCWGSNAYGQLGNGTRVDSTSPQPVVGLTNATAISTGAFSTCALLDGGTVSCWGFENSSVVGLGYDPNAPSATTPQPVVGLTSATAISGGPFHTCALLDGGTVSCWGSNTSAQLGDGTTLNHNSPQLVVGLTNASAISAGSAHSCALLLGGTVSCWGNNSHGQLGTGGNFPAVTPQSVVRIRNVTALSAGAFHTCAVLDEGAVSCWGSNHYGQLGDGNSGWSEEPTSGDSNVPQFAVGVLDGVCSGEAAPLLKICLSDQAPVVRSDSAVATTTSQLTIPVVLNDYDPDHFRGRLTVVGLTAEHGTATVGGQEVGYVPNQGFSGVDHGTYDLCDPLGRCATGSFAVTVPPPSP